VENGSILVTGGSGFIGTNLVNRLIADGYEVTNLDKSPPAKDEHRGYWTKMEILDVRSLDAVIAKAQPKIVIHLAARADSNGKELAGYTENTDGVANVLAALEKDTALCSNFNAIRCRSRPASRARSRLPPPYGLRRK
jgi:GlcNAc-P-P-Und epimerase